MLTRTFHWWSISCHWSESVPGGGPTIDLHNFRKWVSKRSSCRLYIVRCPPAKHATDDPTDSKCRKRFVIETFLSCNIHRFIWKIFDACWRWYCKSTSCNFDPHDVNMPPNHFSPPSRGKTLRFTPAVVVMVLGGWTSFVMNIDSNMSDLGSDHRAVRATYFIGNEPRKVPHGDPHLFSSPNPEHELANCSPRFPTSICKFKSPPRIARRPSLYAPCSALCNRSKKFAKSCSE